MSTPQSERERFRDQGYLLVEDCFDAEEVERMRGEADEILELVVNASLAHGRKSGRLDIVEDDEGDQMVRKVQPVNDLSLAFSEVAEDDRVLDRLAAFMDDDPRLMEEKLNYKQPLPEPTPLEADRATSAFPVHNDWAYYKAQDYPQGVISTAVLLDDFTAENGPLHVWPGSHERHREHERVEGLGLQVPADDLEGQGEDLLAPAGSVLFFHSLLVHSSRPNESGEPRRLMIYSHYPETEGEARGIVPDERNGPTRLRESPYEWAYQRRKERGEVESRFEAPTY
ncbi:MAG: phytanoyl-CoA dioxygenase family protein [Halobacteriales archaeon]